MAPPSVISSKVTLAVPPARLWAFLADTERLNRAVSLPPVLFTPIPGRENKGHYRAETRFLGLKLAYEEFPFEWITGRFYRVERRFASGPLEAAVGGIRLAAAPGGSELEVFAEVSPRNLIGSLVAKKIVARKATHDVLELVRAFERHVAEGQAPPALPPPADLHPELLDLRMSQCRTMGGAQKLRDHLLGASDLEVVRMRPFDLADRWGEDRTAILKLFLRASKDGVLDLQWSVLCPSCRVAASEFQTLSQLKSRAHCETCGIGFGADLADSVEARFSVNAALRAARREIYCIGGPANMPEIVAQLRVAPGATRREAFTPPAGASRVRCYQSPGILGLEGSRIRCRKEGLAVEPGPAGELEVVNELGVEALVVIERESWRERAATAARVTSFQDFRDLYPGEAVAPGEEIGVSSLAVLFTDLKGSTELYARLGDARAFGFVQTHFRYLVETVARHRGGVIKTMGDAVMASFASGRDAIEAGVEMQRGWGSFQQDRADFKHVDLKVGIHGGAAIAINNAGKLDYFGTMVNKAARVQAQSTGGDVVFSQAIAGDPEVRAYLDGAGLPEEIQSVALKGLEGEHVLHRVRPHKVQ